MIPIKLGKQKSQHPENWGEVNRKQFIALTPILSEKEISVADRNRISNIFLDVKNDLLINLPGELLKLHEFLFEDGICAHWFVDLRYGFKKWNGFKPNLSGVNLKRWIYADSYFMRYEAGGDYSDLLKFMAAVYLPKVSAEKILKNHHSFKYVGEHEVAAIIFNFKLIKRFLQLRFPHLFPAAVDKKVKTMPNFGKKTTPWQSWISIFDGLVGDDDINEERYGQLMAMNIFRKLNERIKNNA